MGRVAEPVSYTHLDVYKRQAPCFIDNYNTSIDDFPQR